MIDNSVLHQIIENLNLSFKSLAGVYIFQLLLCVLRKRIKNVAFLYFLSKAASKKRKMRSSSFDGGCAGLFEKEDLFMMGWGILFYSGSYSILKFLVKTFVF